MSSPVTVHLNSLINQFPKYQDTNRIRTDLANVSRHNRTLLPKRGTLTLNTGQNCELLTLEGTVPIWYRGAQYHTPVEIYITENYPASPPMCYVRPTSGMSLKTGHKHVDASGLVYLPYLHEWNARTHNLVALCAEMSSVFGAEPPLYATPASRSSGAGTYARPPVQQQQQQQQQQSSSRSARNASPPQSRPLPPVPDPKVVRQEKEAALTAKLQGELQVMYGQLRLEMDTAFETQARLEDNQREVDADVEELSRRNKELERLLQVAQERCLELDTYLEERKKEGEPAVDELIEPKDRLSDQMLRLVAENAALEDALYYLDVGVTDGVITIDVFLKEVRRMARKQFVARATMKKVEAAQRNLRVQRAKFKEEQAGHGPAGFYPNLPAQQPPGLGGRGYMNGPPPRYTPRPAYGQAAAGSVGTWSGAAAGVGYPSYGAGVARPGSGSGGYGAQASHTQRR